MVHEHASPGTNGRKFIVVQHGPAYMVCIGGCTTTLSRQLFASMKMESLLRTARRTLLAKDLPELCLERCCWCVVDSFTPQNEAELFYCTCVASTQSTHRPCLTGEQVYILCENGRRYISVPLARDGTAHGFARGRSAEGLRRAAEQVWGGREGCTGVNSNANSYSIDAALAQ